MARVGVRFPICNTEAAKISGHRFSGSFAPIRIALALAAITPPVRAAVEFCHAFRREHWHGTDSGTCNKSSSLTLSKG